jgi:uncharacterized radical SAM superfamily Fe-S cluster-containing enzyme
MQIHIVIAVWGENYIKLMADYALPTLLYVDNLSSVAGRHNCVLVLYCKRSEEQTIREIRLLDCIRKLCQVDIINFDPDSSPDKYQAMAKVHHHAAVRAKKLAAKVIFYCPDGVMANGSLERAIFLAEQGKRAVMVPGPRISEAKAGLHLKPLIRCESPISPREMLGIALPILHPETLRCFWDSDNFSSMPAICCWPVENSGGWLMRAFHLHPFMVDFSRMALVDVLEKDTVDGDFLSQAVGIWTDIHIEQDSDNFGLYTITPDDAVYGASTHAAGSIEMLRSQAFAPNVNAFHRHLFSHAIKMHKHDVNDQWLELEEKTGLLLHLALQPLPLRPSPRRDLCYKVQELYWTLSRMLRRVGEGLAPWFLQKPRSVFGGSSRPCKSSAGQSPKSKGSSMSDNFARLKRINFINTNRCNLRCVYCPQGSHPEDYHADLTPDSFEEIFAFISDHGVKEVGLGYYGEITLVDNWWKPVRRLLDAGVKVKTTTNGATLLSPDEVATFARFEYIEWSIDTHDVEILKKVRKKVDVRTIVHNFHLVFCGICLCRSSSGPAFLQSMLLRHCPSSWRTPRRVG